MWLWQWLKSVPLRMHERPKAVASFDDSAVSCRRPDGFTETVRWDELRSVEILTTDAGPFVEDVFLVLHADNHGCVIPQAAEGFAALMKRLQQLPGFNNSAVISAMTCTDNASFPCWQRT